MLTRLQRRAQRIWLTCIPLPWTTLFAAMNAHVAADCENYKGGIGTVGRPGCKGGTRARARDVARRHRTASESPARCWRSHHGHEARASRASVRVRASVDGRAKANRLDSEIPLSSFKLLCRGPVLDLYLGIVWRSCLTQLGNKASGYYGLVSTLD
ncbi:hypothetical protein EDB86DRAFT_2832698 [Lactarius hatsudake]|nr:hypothetical protein EDB86DRAFT_2832698 [Lactarius hatsudake]